MGAGVDASYVLANFFLSSTCAAKYLQVLDTKLADRPLAVMVFLLDLCLLALRLVLYLSLCTDRSILLGPTPYSYVVVLAVITLYFAFREAFQIVNYRKLGEAGGD